MDGGWYGKIIVGFGCSEAFYDDEDSFKDKVWVLTSFDYSRSMENKIRKAVSEETALKDLDSIIPQNQPKNGQEHGEVIDRYSLGKDLSMPKDTRNINKRQQDMEEIKDFFEKAKGGTCSVK
ncbi:hypothetical protein [Phocaeicola sp.]